MVVRSPLLLLGLTLLPTLASGQQVLARYLNLPADAQPHTITADGSGSLFIVSNVTGPFGRPQIRVLKTDSQGATLASIDFGGSVRDTVAGAAVDPSGNLVVVGSTMSPDFPLVAPLVSSTSMSAAFITKLDSQLHGILFSTRLGGTQGWTGNGSGTVAGGVAVDSAGDIYITGRTANTDFPITPGSFQSSPPVSDGFGTAQYAYLTELSADGKKTVFSTYFGGANVSCAGSECIGAFGSTIATAIALDHSGNVVIGGGTDAYNLPVTPGVYAQQCGCGFRREAGFLTKFAAGGAKLIWSTYLPIMGYQIEPIAAMSLDQEGDVYIAGTAGQGLPTTPGSIQPTMPQQGGGFVSEFDPSAVRLLSSTYFGLPFGVLGLALDAQGTIWITGSTLPSSFPLPPGTPLLGGDYVAALSPDLSTVKSMVTAPLGAADKAITLNGGAPAVLGFSSSLLLVESSEGPSLVGVANSADSIVVSNAVAPDELISLYGLDIGPGSPVGAQVVNGAVTSSLGGVQVLFDGVPAPLLYASPTQINAIVPSEVFGHDATNITVLTPTGSLTGPTMLVHPSQPGVFPVAINQDGSVNSASDHPAPPGSLVTIWATGAGRTALPDGAIATGASGRPPLPVSVLLYDQSYNQSLEVEYAGDAPGMVAGVFQVNFRLPSDLKLPLDTEPILQIGDARGSFIVWVKQP
jgi:uncharacterized protein (TIGR03437 family)